MFFTPDPHAAWNGQSPLKSGLAIDRHQTGTLCVALTLPSGTYFAAARHVVGAPSSHTDSMKIYRPTNTWEPSAELLRVTEDKEPGRRDILERLDIAFLKATIPVRNVTPDAAPLSHLIATMNAGDELWLRGCRHSRWVHTTYENDFRPSDEQYFESGLDREHAGVIDLTPLGDAHDQPGNSGTALWRRVGDTWFVVGHLVAVSLVAKKGLVVRYHSAFEELGLGVAKIAAEERTEPVPA